MACACGTLGGNWPDDKVPIKPVWGTDHQSRMLQITDSWCTSSDYSKRYYCAINSSVQYAVALDKRWRIRLGIGFALALWFGYRIGRRIR